MLLCKTLSPNITVLYSPHITQHEKVGNKIKHKDPFLKQTSQRQLLDTRSRLMNYLCSFAKPPYHGFIILSLLYAVWSKKWKETVMAYIGRVQHKHYPSWQPYLRVNGDLVIELAPACHWTCFICWCWFICIFLHCIISCSSYPHPNKFQ